MISRSSGILLHPTCLPGRYGVGDMGVEARNFVDFLAGSGQSLWQVLPLGPTGFSNSPYMCFSAFAGNPLLISPDMLVEFGLLDQIDVHEPPSFPATRVDYAGVTRYKMGLLKKSFRKFGKKFSGAYPADYAAFVLENAFWLEDYALFMALKAVSHEHPWSDWDSQNACRESNSLLKCRTSLSEEIEFQRYVQYVFFGQWRSLRRYCHSHGIQVIGDMPIYVSCDSADVWANRDFFCLDRHGRPLVVAGVPPDYFSATGQRWGNPIYRWDLMAHDGYRWWIDRFRFSFTLFDILRLDHFRGFEAYWEIPATEPTAVLGRWVKGPGADLFRAVESQLGTPPIIAEDLGIITPEVDALRDKFAFPGMRVLQAAFSNDPKAREYRPHNHIKNCVVYTATHDHNTTAGWFSAEPGSETTQTWEEVIRERECALKYAGSDGREIHWDFIRLALGSVADMSVFPLQDLLGLGAQARMNFPSTTAGNWEWRFAADSITPDMTARLRELTKIFDRSPS